MNRLIFVIIPLGLLFLLFFVFPSSAAAQESDGVEASTLDQLNSFLTKIKAHEEVVVEQIEYLKKNEEDLQKKLVETDDAEGRALLRDNLVHTREMRRKFEKNLASVRQSIQSLEEKLEILQKANN